MSAAPPLAESCHSHVSQAEGIIQLAVGEQAAVRSDPRTVELELDPAVEGNPKRLVRFTRRVRHPRPAPPALSC
jgi:hypothetical protein